MPLRSVSRSRSPIRQALSAEAREALLLEFAKFYWVPADGGPDGEVPPWDGRRARLIMRFRDRLLSEVESATDELWDSPVESQLQLHHQAPKSVVVRWQRFTFFEDLTRMSDVLFRGPIEPRHALEVDQRLHLAWRRTRATIGDFEAYMAETIDFRVSAVQIAMVLESARPAEASMFDPGYELPDARTLSSLLSMRCEKDDAEELMEMYRLLCQKLQGHRCVWCADPLDEQSAAGLFDGDTLVVPTNIPKVLVPQCGHPIHTLCFGSQLLPDSQSGGARGHCRRCGLSYAWASIDIDPMASAFCMLFGSYVDKRASEMAASGQIFRPAIISMAEICQSFSQELGGLIAPASAWVMLTKRHAFQCPLEVIDIITESVLDILAPPPLEADQLPKEPLCPLTKTEVYCPEDRPDIDDVLSDASSGLREERKHLTEVFLPDIDCHSDAETECAEELPECTECMNTADDLPPLMLPPAAVQ